VKNQQYLIPIPVCSVAQASKTTPPVKTMKNITILTVGSVKGREAKALEQEYIKRLSPYFRIEIAELPEKGSVDSQGKQILDYVQRGGGSTKMCLIALCVEGRQMSSEAFSQMVTQAAAEDRRMYFVIGGSDGLSEAVKAAAGQKISLSQMTFTRSFARLLLVEQLYRAVMIAEGRTYHK
jgi:23S rRNA (pseudouridine1915-N3)-methyltransferase